MATLRGGYWGQVTAGARSIIFYHLLSSFIIFLYSSKCSLLLFTHITNLSTLPSLPFFFFLKITTGVKKIMLLTLLNFGTRYPLFSFFLLDCSYFDVHFNINMVFVLFLLLLALQLLVLDLLHFMERYEDGDKCLMRFQCFGLPYFSYGLVRRTPWHHQLHSRVGACHWVCCCLSLVH